MWLVLCHADDLAALWAYHGLKRRGFDALELISAEALACSLRWEHRVSAQGASVDIELADGRHIHSRDVQGALNRIQTPPLPFWGSAEPKDRDYVAQEMNAFYVSWIHSLPGRVLNPASAEGVCGAWRHEAIWTRFAAQAGLNTRPFPRDSAAGDVAPQGSAGSRNSVIVVDGMATSADAPPTVAAGCLRLSALAETPLLEVDFDVTAAGDWLFAGASPLPDLRLGGEPILDALATVFRSSNL
jgi:hypothetical protein